MIASVLVLQSLEGLSDRDAVQALATDLRWKVTCGLSITDAGFHPTTLTKWRNRLRKSDRPERIFDAVRDVITSTNVLANKHRRALDSALLDDAVATQDTVTQSVSMIRRVHKAIPEAAATVVVGDDYEQASGKPACAWNDPVARDELVTRLINDALTVLAVVDSIELDDPQQQLVGLLALVAGQDVEPGEHGGSWKIERGAAKHRVISRVDPETRHMHKSRSSHRDGYKAHVPVEPDTGLITACDLTPANAGDGPTGIKLLADEPHGLDVLADSAYGSGDLLAGLADSKHRILIKPWPLARNKKLGENKWGFTKTYAVAAVNIAGIVNGESPSWTRAFSSTRIPLSGLPTLAKAGANVAAHLVGGWASALTKKGDPAPGQGHVRFEHGYPVAQSTNCTNIDVLRVDGECSHLGAALARLPRMAAQRVKLWATTAHANQAALAE